MPSFRTTSLAVATALLATARADYYIEPSSVPQTTRDYWCQSEIATCPSICKDMGASGATVNTCNSSTLSYGCLCEDNRTPNVSQYSLTLPYFTCVQWGIQCQDACVDNNSTCQAACTQDHPCGAQDPSPPNSTSATSSATSGSASSTSSDGAIFSGLGGGQSTAGPPAFEMARLYATMGTLGLFFAGFAYLL